MNGRETHVSGTAVNISSSSRRNSSSLLGIVDDSSAVWGGSHEATSRWLRARATLARLRIMSVSGFDVDVDIFFSPFSSLCLFIFL